MEQAILDKLIEINKKFDKQTEEIEEIKEVKKEIVLLKQEVKDIKIDIINMNDRAGIMYESDFLNKKILNNHEKRITEIETESFYAESKEDIPPIVA